MTENERLTEKTAGCFGYDLKNLIHKNGEFADYNAFYSYNMAVKRLGEYEEIGTVEEFKALKETDEDLRLKYCYEDLSEADNLGYMRGYNNAIDEFAEKISLEISESMIWGILTDSDMDNSFDDTADRIVDYVIDTVKKVAEQMKEGTE